MSTTESKTSQPQPETVHTNTTASYNIKLVENDNILLNQLLSPKDEETIEVTNHFNSLLRRIKDCDGKIIPNLSTWDDAITKLQKSGWTEFTTRNNSNITTTSTNNESVISQETIKTISSLLDISPEQAECISNFTLSSMTSLSILNESNDATKKAITSSTSYLQRVLEFHFQQCLADVRIIVESLIIATGDEDGHVYREDCLDFLKGVDGAYAVGSDSRGLFRLLSDIAFCDGKVEMKEELMDSWKGSYSSFIQCCKKESMNGLLLLCYQYMNVTRIDLALFLTFWEMRLDDEFELWQEASWIGAELFSLWKCSNQEVHSLLDGENVVQEWNVLLELVSRLFQKQDSSSDSLLVIFCMGLFLLFYHESFSHVSNIKSMALECINTSNQYGVFDVLCTSLQSTKSQVVLYHTIAREMFLVMIHTLQNSCSQEEYITLFARVGSVVYDNLGELCGPFWMEWEGYVDSDEGMGLERAVCKLLHLCQRQALAVRQNVTYKENLTRSLPYIQLLCALVHDETTVQYVYGNLLPVAFVKEILKGCTACSSQEVKDVIKSIVALLQHGGIAGRKIFRQIIQLDGLKQIHRTLFSNKDDKSTALQFYNYMIVDSNLVGEECDFAYGIALYTKRDLYMDQVSSATSVHSFLDLSSTLLSHIPSFLTSDKQILYLQLVLDYVKMCCAYFTSPHPDWNTASVSLKVPSIIQEFLEHVTSLVQLNQDEDIVTIRDEILLHILPSKDVATKLATLATTPITKVLQNHWSSIVDFGISASKANENKYSSWFKSEDSTPLFRMNSSDYVGMVFQELHLIPLPVVDEDYEVSSKAIKLLRIWITFAIQASTYLEDLEVPPIELLLSTISTPLFQEVSNDNDYQPFSSICITYLDILLRYIMMEDGSSISPLAEDVVDILMQCIKYSKVSVLPIIQDKNLYTNVVEPILSLQEYTSFQIKVLFLLETAALASLDIFHCFVDKDKMNVLFNFWLDSMQEYQYSNDWDSLKICSASSSLVSTLLKQSSQMDNVTFYSMEDPKVQETWNFVKNMLSHLLSQIQSTTGIEKEFIPILHTCSMLIQYLSTDVWAKLKNNDNSENFREMVEDVMLLPWNSLLKKDLFTLSFQSGCQQVLEQKWMGSFCSSYLRRMRDEEYKSYFHSSSIVSFLDQLDGMDLSFSLSSFLDAMHLLSAQSSLMSSIGQFIQLSLAVTHREKNVLGRREEVASPEVNRGLFAYTSWIQPLFESILFVLIDCSSTSPLIWSRLQVEGEVQSCMFLHFYRKFGNIVSVLVQSLLSLSHYASEDKDSLKDMFELLYQGSSRLFTLLDPPSSSVLSVLEEERQSFYDTVMKIGCQIKQNVLSCAMILSKQYVISSTSVQRTPNAAITETPQRSHFSDKKSMVEPRIGFIRLICDTLRSLHYEEGDFYQYNFESTDHQWNLYLSCLFLLDGLISLKTISVRTFKIFCRSLVEVIENEDLVSLLLQHFQVACRVAADTYSLDKNEIRERKHEHSVFVAQRIMDVFHHIMGVVLSSDYTPSYSKLVSLIIKDETFFYSLMENPLLRLATRQWSSCDTKTRNIRGYIVLGGDTNRMDFVGSSRTRPQAKVDPVHLLWRTSLSTLSSLLGLSSASDVSDGDDWKTCFQHIIDFLCSYEVAITSLLMNIKSDKPIARNVNNFSPPSNQFNVNYLQELCDTLSFMSEVLSEARYRNLLATTHPSFYNNFISNLLEITRYLSAFVGSAAIARKLFSMLSHKKRHTSFDSPGMISRHYSTALRDTPPVSMSPFPSSSSSFIGSGGGTIPNARHEAIGYSHYASSCCVVMTAEDAADYSSVTSHGDANPVSDQNSNTLDKFHFHVNNKFTLRTELCASKCLFHALGILSNTHSAWVGFVPFQSHESKKFFTFMHEAVEVGNIIAVRPPLDSSKLVPIKEKEDLRYATIVATHSQSGTNSWDVEYFPSFIASDRNEIASERFVSTSRFAGMIDNSKWKSLLAYDVPVIPKSVSELASLNKISIAHIWFVFQWCQEHMGNENDIDDLPNRSSHIKLLAERASIFLSMDMLCSTQDQTSNSTTDTRVRNMAQLLDLFLDDYQSASTATFSTPATPVGFSFGGNSGVRTPSSVQRRDSINLRDLLDRHVWETTVSLLQSQIDMYRRRISLVEGEVRSVTPLGGEIVSLF